MAKISVKLGKGANHFYDLVTKTSVYAGKTAIVESRNVRVREALGVGTLIRAEMSKEDSLALKAQEKIEKDQLMKLTRPEIEKQFSFFDEDHLLEMKKARTKTDLITLIRKIESEYED